jgi:hypothetical protein
VLIADFVRVGVVLEAGGGRGGSTGIVRHWKV